VRSEGYWRLQNALGLKFRALPGGFYLQSSVGFFYNPAVFVQVPEG